MNMVRRRPLLASAGAASAVALSGCVSAARAWLPGDGGAELEGDPPAIPSNLECDRDPAQLFPDLQTDELDADDLRRIEFDDPVSLGRRDGWQLAINSQEFEYGETAEIELSRSGLGAETGSGPRWRIEVFTEKGWQDIRVLAPPGGGRTLELIDHGGGTVFEWDIELTEAGILDAYGGQALGEAVCPELQTGRHRFVYEGLHGVNWDIGIEFDLYR